MKSAKGSKRSREQPKCTKSQPKSSSVTGPEKKRGGGKREEHNPPKKEREKGKKQKQKGRVTIHTKRSSGCGIYRTTIPPHISSEAGCFPASIALL